MLLHIQAIADLIVLKKRTARRELLARDQVYIGQVISRQMANLLLSEAELECQSLTAVEIQT